MSNIVENEQNLELVPIDELQITTMICDQIINDFSNNINVNNTYGWIRMYESQISTRILSRVIREIRQNPLLNDQYSRQWLSTLLYNDFDEYREMIDSFNRNIL